MAIQSLEIQEFLMWFTKTQIFEVFISQKSAPNAQFGLIFDEAIKENKNSVMNTNIEMNQKIKTVKQISIRHCSLVTSEIKVSVAS